MQCVQCWNDIKREDIKCDVCNEMFCSQECLDRHVVEVNDKMRFEEERFEEEMMDSQDKYREPNEPFGRYPWER